MFVLVMSLLVVNSILEESGIFIACSAIVVC